MRKLRLPGIWFPAVILALILSPARIRILDFLHTLLVNLEKVETRQIDQRNNGAVTADRVFLSRSGFLALYDIVDGHLSDVVGTSELLPPGRSTNVTVRTKGDLPDGNYMLILHYDNGSSTWNDKDVDKPVMRNGSPIGTSITLRGIP